MPYTSAAEAAATIRTDLKKHYKWTTRQVSVRARNFSGGSALDIAIHDPAVDIREVRNAADRHEHVDRCPITHEILAGGNRYLSVSYSDKAAEVLASQQPQLCADIIAKARQLEAEGAQGQGLDVGGYIVWRHRQYDFSVTRQDDTCARGVGFSYMLDKLTAKDVAATMLALRSRRH